MKIEQEAERPTPAHWWMLGVLCLVNAVAFIDRAAPQRPKNRPA
jgi:hypothetical protein